jgi:hypothetical protein
MIADDHTIVREGLKALFEVTPDIAVAKVSIPGSTDSWSRRDRVRHKTTNTIDDMHG